MKWPSFFSSKPTIQEPYTGKVEVFSRHCIFSTISQHKKRFDGFSREICTRNLLATIDLEQANLTFILDTANGDEHFLSQETNHPVIKIQGGTEARAFLQLLDYVEAINLHPQTILYFVEDDYLHCKGWMDVLLEGMQIPGVDYVTLYDHNDKYQLMYSKLMSKIYATSTCHWRTIPSTTQTFAVRMQTLREDLLIHRRFSERRNITADHQKFMRLCKLGRTLVSSMPGWSTHAEPPFASPCVDWDGLIQTYKGDCHGNC